MKSLTIHGLDEQLEKLLKDKAKANGTSLNKTIKGLLEEALGIRVKFTSKPVHREYFSKFCGIWTESDLDEFKKVSKDLREIDAEDWQ